MNISFIITTCKETSNLEYIINSINQEIARLPFVSHKIYIIVNGIHATKIYSDKKNIDNCNWYFLETMNKNISLNFARSIVEQDNFVILVDDDIEFGKNIIKKTINVILEQSSQNIPLLIGANFRVRGNLSFFQRIFSFPFNNSSPSFCMGGFMGIHISNFPYLPDSKNIADDAYICNYFYNSHIKHGSGNIIKIDECYMEVHGSLFRWFSQQKRINIGVMNAYEEFENTVELIETFEWKYNSNITFENFTKRSFTENAYLFLKTISNILPKGRRVTWKIWNN